MSMDFLANLFIYHKDGPQMNKQCLNMFPMISQGWHKVGTRFATKLARIRDRPGAQLPCWVSARQLRKTMTT